MPEAPPTLPGPIEPARAPRLNNILLGMIIHAAIVAVPCFAVPLAMDSNIWPIAGVIWSVLTMPVALVTGAIAGLATRRWRRGAASTVIIITGLAVAIAAGIIISHNR